MSKSSIECKLNEPPEEAPTQTAMIEFPMTTAQTYQLKIFDQPLAQFQFEKTLTGFRARGLETNPTTAESRAA